MTISRRPFLIAAACAWGGSAYAEGGGDVVGDWYGALDLGSQRLRLRLRIDDGPRATLFSLDQGNAPIPVATTRIERDQISLSIPVIGASFEGRIVAGAIEGRFTQRGTMPLRFTRQPQSEEGAGPGPLTAASLAQARQQAGMPALAAAASSRAGRSLNLFDGVRMMGRNEPVSGEDLWHVGSITKSMTATLVARCVEAGLVSWTDTIGAVLGQSVPDMHAAYRDVDFRHLLSHRSGLPSNLEWSDIFSFAVESADARADRLRYAQLGLRAPPGGAKGQHLEYSNTGYVVAGAMLEAKLGEPWERSIERYVFAPLGMTSAGFGAPGAVGAYDQPIGHGPGLQPFPPGAERNDNPAVLGPAGRVHLRLGDMITYLNAHRDRTSFLSGAQWDALHTPPFGGEYAMGWAVRNGMLWHNGSNTLWYAEAMFDRARGVSAVVATNDGRVDGVGPAVGRTLLAAAQAVA